MRKCHAPNALNNLATGLVRLSILGLFQSSGDPKSREAPMSSVIVEKNAPSGGLVLRVRPPSGALSREGVHQRHRLQEQNGGRGHFPSVFMPSGTAALVGGRFFGECSEKEPPGFPRVFRPHRRGWHRLGLTVGASTDATELHVGGLICAREHYFTLR